MDAAAAIAYPRGMDEIRHGHRAVYDANAGFFDSARSRGLVERAWLVRLLAHAPAGGRVLDLGCGGGEPIAGWLVAQGFEVTGLDFSPAMLALARSRFPAAHWIEGDMRELDLLRRFHGMVGWDSFFHLTRQEQRDLLPRLARHLKPDAGLLLTVGPEDGEALGRVGDGTVYHASLSPAEYRDRMAEAGLEVEAFVPEDPACGGRSMLLAARTAG